MEWVPDLRQLRAFVAVAEEGSFTLGAKRIHVTQSAVSHSLRSLEEQLECSLLDRSGKRVVPTAEGELLLHRCRRMLREIDQVEKDMESLRRWGQTRIRIGAPHSLCHSLIPSVLRELKDAFPRCEPYIEVDNTSLLLDKLAESSLDVVVGLKPGSHSGEGYRSLYHDRMALVISPYHPLAGVEGPLDDQLHEHQFIIYAKANESHRLIYQWIQQQTGGTGKKLVLGDMQAIKEMAKIGLGIGIIAPWVAARELEEGSLIMIQADSFDIQREWGVFHAPKHKPSLVEEAFIGLTRMAFDILPQHSSFESSQPLPTGQSNLAIQDYKGSKKQAV